MQTPEEKKLMSNPLQPLQQKVASSLDGYFAKLGDSTAANLYDMFLAEIEEPLLRSALQFCAGNQSKAAAILGLSRGTLRKKLKQYDLITKDDIES